MKKIWNVFEWIELGSWDIAAETWAWLYPTSLLLQENCKTWRGIKEQWERPQIDYNYVPVLFRDVQWPNIRCELTVWSIFQKRWNELAKLYRMSKRVMARTKDVIMHLSYKMNRLKDLILVFIVSQSKYGYFTCKPYMCEKVWRPEGFLLKYCNFFFSCEKGNSALEFLPMYIVRIMSLGHH